MNFIKKVFDDNTDEAVHLQFKKFSKGEFRERATINAKKQAGGKYTISTTAEFANELVRPFAEKLGDEKTKVKGAIVSTENLKDNPEFNELLADSQVKQFQGVKRYLVEKEMSGTDLLKLLDNNPKAFFALSFLELKDSSLKIKPKAPKSGKPSSKGEDKPKADFCTLKTKDQELVKSFVFEKSDFTKAEITHTYFINELIIPEELKASNDFAKIREEAKRKGKIVRKATIDDKEIITEKEFVA